MQKEPEPTLEACLKKLFPTKRITESTSDSEIAALYPVPANLLRRFEVVKKLANFADGERDALRKYIQKHFSPGMYGNVMLQISIGTDQVYPNSEAKYALTHYLQATVPKPNADAMGFGVVVLETTCSTAEELVDELLEQLQVSRDAAVAYIAERFLGSGFVLDNETLYVAKGSMTLTITEMPNDTKTLTVV